MSFTLAGNPSLAVSAESIRAGGRVQRRGLPVGGCVGGRRLAIHGALHGVLVCLR